MPPAVEKISGNSCERIRDFFPSICDPILLNRDFPASEFPSEPTAVLSHSTSCRTVYRYERGQDGIGATTLRTRKAIPVTFRSCLFAMLLVGVSAGAGAGAKADRFCAAEKAVNIAFVGDLLFQDELQRIAMRQGSSYRRFWSRIDPILQAVDAVYGNLEGTLASNITYQGLRTADPGTDATSEVFRAPPGILNFNYHKSLAADLMLSGFRIISTANNHVLDRGVEGIDQTIEELGRQGISAVGTRHSKGLDAPWGKLTTIGSLTVGWVACTYGTNGHPDTLNQVLDCFEQRDEVLAAISSLAARTDVAAVFFVPHWGIENHYVIERRQEQLGRDAVSAGATAVVGTHPHVLQEWHWVTSPLGDRAPIVYSTGNFVSAQPAKSQRNGAVILVTLQTHARTPKAKLASVRYVLTEFVQPPGIVTFRQSVHSLHNRFPDAERLDPTQLDAIIHCRR
ncbi:MAG: hypothetical protein C0511_05405 [Hyphomicrobium sp.]|nr:hypothetical protein [Hyphomicrobium sp.]